MRHTKGSLTGWFMYCAFVAHRPTENAPGWPVARSVPCINIDVFDLLAAFLKTFPIVRALGKETGHRSIPQAQEISAHREQGAHQIWKGLVSTPDTRWSKLFLSMARPATRE